MAILTDAISACSVTGIRKAVNRRVISSTVQWVKDCKVLLTSDNRDGVIRYSDEMERTGQGQEPFTLKSCDIETSRSEIISSMSQFDDPDSRSSRFLDGVWEAFLWCNGMIRHYNG
ncbi:MAG: hypothetical protein LC132_05900 [Burkholderiales bacterium]|nr:hypothetical protein [Burkholderiales bacterium]